MTPGHPIPVRGGLTVKVAMRLCSIPFHGGLFGGVCAKIHSMATCGVAKCVRGEVTTRHSIKRKELTKDVAPGCASISLVEVGLERGDLCAVSPCFLLYTRL
jgi:hypothetical protein